MRRATGSWGWTASRQNVRWHETDKPANRSKHRWANKSKTSKFKDPRGRFAFPNAVCHAWYFFRIL